jgi:tRNA 5-methylaminomethyl-2-thiouridine biosynthesis bifunctional protein
MVSALQPAQLDWSQGTPYSRSFGDVYFSIHGGLEESRHVFLLQNNLPARFQACGEVDAFTIAETGFGTGLNWLATINLWQQTSSAGWLHYISVEKHPLTAEDLAKAHAYWPELAELSTALIARYPRLLPGFHRIVFPQWRTTLTLFLGDAITLFSQLDAQVDAWFLDGFAPDRNPDMWSDHLFEQMAKLSNPLASFATFTAAGHVRRGLQAVGFAVEKVPGHGQKREMLRGSFSATTERPADAPWLHRPLAPYPTKTALIVGAGVTGASIANRLEQRGWKVIVVERDGEVATGGSGNPAAIMYPKLGPANQTDNEFAQQAWLFTLGQLESGELHEGTWNPCGVLQLLTPHQQRSLQAAADHPWLPDMVRKVDAEEANHIAGITINHDALWYPAAGWLDARSYCQQLLTHPNIQLITHAFVSTLKKTTEGWQLLDQQNHLLAEGAIVIMANGKHASALQETAFLPLKAVSGQISIMPASQLSLQQKTVVCHDGYISPPLPNGTHCLGASYHPDTESRTETIDDHVANHKVQQTYLPALMDSLLPPTEWKGRVSIRCQSPDYLPLIGPVAAIEPFCTDYAGLRDGKVLDYPLLKTQPGLYVALGLGSRGFSLSLLCAEILAAEICNEPSPVSRKVREALHPMRFAVRDLKRNCL